MIKGVLTKLLLGLTLIVSGAAKADPPSVHGMLVFGDKVTYASHLPMFHHPHDYQLVMKVKFHAPDRREPGVLAAYKLLKAKGKTLFTIEPKPMDLTKVMSGEITHFAALLYDGHFERGGTPIGAVTVQVETFLVNKKLDPAEPEKNEYLLFGEKAEFFLVHLINGKPSFDLVAKTSQLSRGPVIVKLTNKPTNGVIYHEEKELQ